MLAKYFWLTINFARRRAAPLLIGTIVILAVAGVIFRLIIPALPITFQRVATERVLPNQAVELVFSTDPTTHHCQISRLDDVVLNTSSRGNSLIVTPEPFWSPGQTNEVKVSCDRYQTTIAFPVPAVEDLTDQEAAGLQGTFDVDFVQTLEEHFAEKPWAAAFPLERATYTLYYFDDRNQIVIGSNQIFADSAKAKILADEKKSLTELGVPDNIPLVFARDLTE